MSFVRIKLHRTAELRWSTSQTLTNLLCDAIQRTAIPASFRSGKNPRPDVRMAPSALPWCYQSCEYADIALTQPMRGETVSSQLAASLPAGLELRWARRMPNHTASIAASLRGAAYAFHGALSMKYRDAFLNCNTFPYKRVRKLRERWYDLRQVVSMLRWRREKVELYLAHLQDGAVRPHEALAAIFHLPWEEAVLLPTERTALHIDHGVLKPFASEMP